MNNETKLKLAQISVFDIMKKIPLSDKQYCLCRDNGYSADEIAGKTHDWFQLIKNEVEYKNSTKMLATEKQMEYISCLAKSDSLGEITYSKAREIIRHAEIRLGEDSRYIRLAQAAIARAEAKVASNTKMRNQRKNSSIDVEAEFERVNKLFKEKLQENLEQNNGEFVITEELESLNAEHSRLEEAVKQMVGV